MSESKGKDIRFEEFDRICRFCFKANVLLYSLFEENECNYLDRNQMTNVFEHAVNILKKSLGLEIYLGDGLPESICKCCCDKLIFCHDFWNQCESATEHLNKIRSKHINTEKDIKQESCLTEAVYLEQTHENLLNDSSLAVVKVEKFKRENEAERIPIVDISTNENVKPKPKKRIRKKPDYQHCFICGLRCRYLNRHIQIMHSNDTKYECDICKTYTARSKGQLYLHMHHKHINNVETEFVCSVCQRNFKNLKKLNNHVTNKHPARRHPCSHCHLIFKSERTLLRHQSIHTGERNFICEECGKAFRQTETLRNHQLRHFPPTVPCPHCDKMFYVKSQLRNHEGIHTGVRPWNCDICGASFVASSGLTVHRNKHKKENLFPTCKLCGEQFNDRLDLRMHMNDHRKALI